MKLHLIVAKKLENLKIIMPNINRPGPLISDDIFGVIFRSIRVPDEAADLETVEEEVDQLYGPIVIVLIEETTTPYI